MNREGEGEVYRRGGVGLLNFLVNNFLFDDLDFLELKSFYSNQIIVFEFC